MPLSRLALRCDVDGHPRVLSADGVRLVALRLPVLEAEGSSWVELDGERWLLVDDRTCAPALTDHFVFLREGRSRRGVVVDRVLDLVLASELSAEDGPGVER